ncbi:MAG: DNA adenine methylase, partial [Candidatus Binatia bacterium]
AGKGERLAEILEQGSMMASDESEIAGGALGELLMSAFGGVPNGADTVLTRYYGGIYFSYKQAADLDAIGGVVRSLARPARDTALAALLSTASQTVSTVGNQFAQPIRPRSRDGRVKHESVRAVARARQLDVFEAFQHWLTQYQELPPSAYSHQVMRGDFRDVLDKTTATVSIIYADPPYTRDHYSRFYHVLETIAVGDEPNLSTVTIGTESRISRGLYRAQRHQSPFCIKTEVRQAFRDLVQGAAKHGAPLLISYSPYSNGSAARPETRLMTIPDIESIVDEHFDHVEVRSLGRIAHSKLNAERLNIEINPEAEVVIIGRF